MTFREKLRVSQALFAYFHTYTHTQTRRLKHTQVETMALYLVS